MNAKQLDAAERVLVELEGGIERAPVSTITHPDYMRISAGVDQARDAFESARGGASFSGWLESARSAIGVADHTVAEMPAGVTAERFASLERVAKRIERLVVAGESYQAEGEYAAVAGQLEERLLTCAELVQHARWQVTVAEALAGPLGDARRAEQALVDAAAERHRQLWGAALAGFKSCAAVALLHGGKPGASDAPLPTPYGELAIGDVQDLCVRRARDAAARLKSSKPIVAAPPVAVEERVEVPAATSGDGPTSRWRDVVAEVRVDVAFAARETERAEDANHQAERVVALANALGALQRCASRAAGLLALDQPRWQEARPEAREVDALREIAARCRRDGSRIQKRLDD